MSAAKLGQASEVEPIQSFFREQGCCFEGDAIKGVQAWSCRYSEHTALYSNKRYIFD